MQVISGGQTGIDQAALRAAKAIGLRSGGRMPKGWRTEDGPRPEFQVWFGMTEGTTASYKDRTYYNVVNSDATLILAPFDRPGDSGTQLTVVLAATQHKPCLIVEADEHWQWTLRVEEIRHWLATEANIAVLNVAGPRESRWPGCGERAERLLREVFA